MDCSRAIHKQVLKKVVIPLKTVAVFEPSENSCQSSEKSGHCSEKKNSLSFLRVDVFTFVGSRPRQTNTSMPEDRSTVELTDKAILMPKDHRDGDKEFEIHCIHGLLQQRQIMMKC